MSDNLALWHAVEKTPLEHTKAITGKSYKGTSPKPHYLVQKATETFGPCGIGWGFTVEERIEQGAMYDSGDFERMHIAKVKVWYKWEGERGEVEHIGGTSFSGRRQNGAGAPYTDEDAPKKSVTDALVKALSMIGFAGDIFMGRYDDSKYLGELREDERLAKLPPKPTAISAAEQKRQLAEIDKDLLDCGTVQAVNACAKEWSVRMEGWSNDYRNIAIPKFKERRDEIIAAENDDTFPGDTDIKNVAGRTLHTMEGV